jgi:death-on-curing protein
VIRFLTVDDVNRLHELTIEAHGGRGGVRDSGLLEAAVAMARQTFEGDYLHHGIPAMAAAYLFHLCQGHPYVDGNKRTAVLAALAFLDVNQIDFLPDPNELERVTMKVATGELTKSDLTAWFERRLT